MTTIFARLARAFARPLACAAMLAVASLAGAPNAAAEPAIWRVSDADSTVWVFGSVHALPEDAHWRRPEIDAALAAADAVYFEIALDEKAEAEILNLALQRAFNPPGVRLSQLLSAEGRARLDRVAASLGVTAAPFERMRPWMAMVQLDGLITTAEGAAPEYGVDSILEAEARGAGRDVRSLELPAQALDYLADLPDADQIRLLEQSLVLYEEHPSFGKELEAAWLAGDLETLETLLLGALAQMPPSVYDRLVRTRNLDWAEQLDAFMAGSEDALVVVGAGHMLGDDSLVLMLEQRGYTVERR